MNKEIDHENIVALKEVILEDKSIYMVFEYAEHDFLVRFLVFISFFASANHKLSKLSTIILKHYVHLYRPLYLNL